MPVKQQLSPSGLSILDTPVSQQEKAGYVRNMFDGIAHRYDLLNTILSAGMHDRWRKFATRCAALYPGDNALDLCTGTGSWTPYLRNAVGPAGLVIGLDFSIEMLHNGSRRFAKNDTLCVQADAVVLPFTSDTFNAATIGFGIRNVADIPGSLREIARVLKPGGRLVILEFADPHPGLFKEFYSFYSQYIMPNIGGMVSGSKDAYTYLPASVERFASREDLAGMMKAAGLDEIRYIDLMNGLVCVHVGVKLFTDSCG